MKSQILAIDSTEQACSVALSANGEITQRLEMAPRKHSEMLLPMVEQLLEAATISLTQLDAIAFACGPGSFTGLRIATGVVQGLAYGAELPVVPVSSLASLAHTAFRQNALQAPHQFLVALDARMNEVYVAPYRVDKIGVVKCLSEELVCPPQDVAVHYGDLFSNDPSGDASLSQKEGDIQWSGAGSGWCYHEIFQQQLSSLRDYRTDVMIEAMDVLYLAETLFERGVAVSAEKALPVYLRESVTWKKLPGR